MRWMSILLVALTLASPLHANGERAGDFDYYVLSLSWSPTWCALEGDARNARQCTPSRHSGWILHGLWPQYDQGYPSNCRTAARDPSRGQTNAMADIMGAGGAAWHQWKKHGRCSGLKADEYFETARRAYNSIQRPAILRKLHETVKLPASVIEAAFLKSNPGLSPDTITITCKKGHIQEARICLTRDLKPRNCGADVVRDCQMQKAILEPVR